MIEQYFIRSAVEVVKSDTTVLNPTKRIYVGSAGHLTVLLLNDVNPVTFKNVPAGTVLSIRSTKVMDATTASDILALY